MSDKKYYQIIVNDEHFKSVLYQKHYHANRKPKYKMFWQSQEKYDASVVHWENVNGDMIENIVTLYKYHFPEIYDDFEIHNFGFTAGRIKTMYLWVSKFYVEEEMGEEHA